MSEVSKKEQVAKGSVRLAARRFRDATRRLRWHLKRPARLLGMINQTDEHPPVNSVNTAPLSDRETQLVAALTERNAGQGRRFRWGL